jgi:hypothetical protein
MKPKHRDMSDCQCPANLGAVHLDTCSHWHDPVKHPRHYTTHASGIEQIQVTEHMSFCLGNAVKYIWRAGKKTADPTEDLQKAIWYLQREVDRLAKSKAG